MGVRNVAIMTGGGDCPGLNAVIRAAVKVGIQKYNWRILGVEDAFSGLVDTNYHSPRGNRWLGEEDVRLIYARGGTILGTSNRSHPFEYRVENHGEVTTEDVSDRVMDNFKKLDLEALISIGGDGSMAIAQRFFEKGLPVVGVPKTIDNDLAATDVTFGFHTAVQVATEALDRIRDTAESHDRVMLVEVMGRHAGWIALEAGIAGGAHAILLPEIPYDVAPIVARIQKRRARGEPYSLIVVAEGAKPREGHVSIMPEGPGIMPRLMGAAAKAATALSEHLEADMRVTVLGHIQRGGSPSAFDRVLATRFGHHAAELVAAGDFGKMVALREPNIVAVPISEAVSRPKRVDPAGQRVSTARALGVIFGDED